MDTIYLKALITVLIEQIRAVFFVRNFYSIFHYCLFSIILQVKNRVLLYFILHGNQIINR